METGKLTVTITADTRIVLKKVKVFRDALDMVIEGLEQIDNGCPECGNHLVRPNDCEDVNTDAMKVYCSDCGYKYTYKRQEK